MSTDECPCCDGTGFVSDEMKERVAEANAALRERAVFQKFEEERLTPYGGVALPATSQTAETGESEHE